jgi:ribonuclease HII
MRVGVDEAGKGPVLGSMFVAAVRADPVALPDGVDDSKSLSAQRRETLSAGIRKAADAVAVVEVPVEHIDDPGTDMNGLTVAAHAEAIGTVANPGDEALADAADTDADRFGRHVGAKLELPDVFVRGAHGADATDPVVAAASILAKVERDAHVEALATEYGDLGSGYPSDPATREFLRKFVGEWGNLPDCARTSWQTSEDVLAAAEQSSLGEF